MPRHPDPLAQKFTSKVHRDTYPEIASSDHKGRTVLITGASKGIGRATAISYAKAGTANIIIGARSGLDETENEILAVAVGTPPTVVKLKLDVASEQDVWDAAKMVTERFGKLDILINNAGYLEDWHLIADTDAKDWWLSWEINLRGPYLMTRAFLPLLLKGSVGYILNISSIGALNLYPSASSYQTNKFALLKFTEFTQVEYGDKGPGIIAISLHPGGVATELALNMPPDMHTVLVDTPELAADSFAWLTQERREWLGGRYISVCWDLPELVSRKDEIVEDDKLKMRIVT